MDYPIRHRNHILETLSDRHLKNYIPADWVLNQFYLDYGTDYNCEISKDGHVIGINFTIQLKSKEKESNKEFVIVNRIKRSTINRWLNRLEPTMIIVFIKNENEAFWLWLEDNTVNLTKNNKEFQIKVPRENKLSEIKWENVHNKLESIFSKRYMLYEVPHASLDLRENAIWANFFNNEYDKALFGFNEMIKLNNDPLLWNVIALCHYGMFHLKEALIAITKALEGLKDHQTLLLNKAAILTELGITTNDKNKLKIAVEIYEKLISNGSSSADLYYNYANALNGLELKKEAESTFLKCLKLNPNKAEAWKNLGSVYHDTKFYKKELECYEFALRINPNLQEAIYSKGVTLFKAFGKVEEGLKFMIKGISISNKFEILFPYAYFWVAEAYLELGKIEEAKVFNEKCVHANPDDKYMLLQKQRIEKATNT